MASQARGLQNFISDLRNAKSKVCELSSLVGQLGMTGLSWMMAWANRRGDGLHDAPALGGFYLGRHMRMQRFNRKLGGVRKRLNTCAYKNCKFVVFWLRGLSLTPR